MVTLPSLDGGVTRGRLLATRLRWLPPNQVYVPRRSWGVGGVEKRAEYTRFSGLQGGHTSLRNASNLPCMQTCNALCNLGALCPIPALTLLRVRNHPTTKREEFLFCHRALRVVRSH